MKHSLLFFSATLIIALAFLQSTNAQYLQTPEGEQQQEDWFIMMQDEDARYEDVRTAFYTWWGDRTDYKGTGYKIFKRWEYINRHRALPDGKLPTSRQIMETHNQFMEKAQSVRSASGNWELVGPSSYPVNATSQPTGMGRINAIAFHPSDDNTIYVGAPSGGIWKTIDGGDTWTNISGNIPTLGVSAIVVHPANPDIIYIGTGDRDAGNAPGIGVYMTTDGGTTWAQSGTGMPDVTVGKMIMHPSDPNTILAATSGGVYKTTDGGNTWSAKLAPGNFKDIAFKPGDPSIVYATLIFSPARLYRSSNTGNNWTHITSGIPTSGIGSRMVIGVSPDDPAYIYLVQIKSSNATFAGLLLSTDSGLNFAVQSTSPNLLGYECDGSGTASQATYDLCIAVDPNDASTVYVGGINVWKSTDAGVNWNINTHWIGGSYGSCGASVHADDHVLEWSPLSGNLYLGHDGGVHYTEDGTNWSEISAGLEIAQMYKLGQSATVADLVIVGKQDNGTAVTNGTDFTTVIGGDGTESAIDYSNSNYRYGCYVLGDIKRSTGGSYFPIAEAVNGITEAGGWVTPYALHVTDPNTMFAGFNNVYRTNNVKASSYTSIYWDAISSGEVSSCEIIEQSPADPDILYVVRSNEIQRTDNANDDPSLVAWEYCTLPDGYTPSDLEAHPADPDIIYATAGYTIYKSEDKGITWSDMDPNYTLPPLLLNCLVYDVNSNEGIYIGNTTSVLYKDATMTDWMLYSQGLPPADIRELEIFYDPVGTQHRIKAATYGRGLWQSDLIETGILNPVNFQAFPGSDTKINLEWGLNPGNDNVLLAYNTTPSFGTPMNGTSYAPSSVISGGGTVVYNGSAATFQHTALSAGTAYYYKLWSYDNVTDYSTGTTDDATTFCMLIESFPWSEGFEYAGSMPACWTQEYVNGSNNWEMRTAGTNGYPASAHSGTYLARDRSLIVNSNYITKFVPPPFNIEGLVATLTFWHTQEYWASQDVLRVYYKNTPTGNWTEIAAYTNSIATWTQETIMLPNPTATYFIAFQGTVNAGYGICIDDLQITGTYNLTWTGAADSDWSNAGNWSGGFVPVSLNNVTIPDVANDPVINLPPNSPARCNSIVIEPGATLQILPGSMLITNE
jgi:photosystem II stability/assembly factor-like uncharacterized protein